MWRGTDAWGVIAAALLAPAVAHAQSVTPPAPPPALSEQDRVADYLERLNLRGLLLDHLSASMRSADGESRVKIAERLARHYASLLADAPDEARRAELAAKAEGLLKMVPQARAYELRVGVLKTRYTSAEEGAERVRLRLSGPEARAEVVKSLSDVRTQLASLTADLTKKEEGLSRALDTAPADADRVERELADTRRWRSTAQYFAAWAGLYGALLEGASATAAEAEKDFKAILAAGDAPTPAKFDKGLLRYEHVARAAIGLAVCRGLQGQDVEATAWLDMVQESSTTDAGARAAVLRWRVTVLAGAGRWADLQRSVQKWKSGADQPAPAVNLPKGAVTPADTGTLDGVTARLLAVLALESRSPATQGVARSLARVAVGDLIARKQLGAVLDLARRYGADALTDPDAPASFIASYVRGMQAYDGALTSAKAAGMNLEEPASTPALANQFGEAAAQLTRAAESADGDSFKTERAAATAASARALFLSGKAREAAERFSLAFERARDAGDAASAQESLYLAVATLEKAGKHEPGRVDQLAIEERIEQLSTLFIKTYPSSDRAVALTLRSIARTDRTDEEAVRVLRSVSRDSPAYESARRQLARLLYRLYRAAPAPDRPFASARYLKVADEVFAFDRKQAIEARDAAVWPAVDRAVSTGRQMLDALLSVSPPDAGKAEQVMGGVRQVLITTGTPGAAWADEMDFRSVQIEVARGRLEKADALTDGLRARADSAKPGTEALASARRFHAAARRVLLQNADAALRAAASDGEKAAAAARVLSNGLPLTDEIVPSREALREGASAAVVSRVAEAGATLWRTRRDAAARDAAIRLDRALVAARGPSGEPLTRLAELSEAAGDGAGALEAWRSLTGVLPEGSEQWHRAKYEAFRLLADSDAKGAASAVTQYLVLNPSGPDPWHGKIKELGGKLGVAAPAAPPGAGSGAGGGNGGAPR